MSYRYIVFDRDGTLIKHNHIIYIKEDIILFEDTIKSIKFLKKHNFKFFIQINQVYLENILQ